jgi:ABC-type nickel/cobalt efflux system permease component RcnA
MLLALSTSAFLWGFMTVLCFSLGLAVALAFAH